MSLPNPVEQKSHDVINNKLSRVMKEVAEESMKRAAVEENSSSPDNLLTVSGDGTWKTRGHSSLIGKNYSGSAGKMEVDGMLRIFNRSEELHNLKYSNYTGDGDTKTFNALSENKPYGDDHLIQKIECVGHVQKRMGTRLRKLKLVYSKKKLSDGKTIGGKGRLTDSLIDKLAHYYVNAIRCNSTSVKEMRKAIWAVWGHSCSTDDEPMHWFCPTNPNTWYLSHPALLKKCLGGKTQNPNESLNSLIWKFCPKTIGSSLQIAEIASNLATSVLNDGNQILISILEKFGLKINRNVCVSLAERDNRRIFTSRQRRLEKIGSRVERNQTTVIRICDLWMQEGTMDRRGRPHPPQCTPSREDRQIVRMVVMDRSVTSRTVAQHIESVTRHSVSARTIRRRLQQSGLFARRSLLGLPLTQSHRRLRRQWCDERRMWVAEWKEVVLIDELRICLQHHDGRIRVWRHRGERMLNSCVMHRYTGPAPGIMVLGGVGYHSSTPLVRIAGTLNSQRYISELLEPIVLPYLQAWPQPHLATCGSCLVCCTPRTHPKSL
ncbi:transposable element Tcb1 transposase [Trichonephila clavipes]|nr:transposable element Tcb1 transposase [Trichonephila clavipes]